jgi:hypothetical protein
MPFFGQPIIFKSAPIARKPTPVAIHQAGDVKDDNVTLLSRNDILV